MQGYGYLIAILIMIICLVAIFISLRVWRDTQNIQNGKTEDKEEDDDFFRKKKRRS